MSARRLSMALETTPVSPKVGAGAAGSTTAGAAVVLVTYLVEAVWGVELPLLAQGALLVVVSSIGGAIAAYLKRDPLRRALPDRTPTDDPPRHRAA